LKDRSSKLFAAKLMLNGQHYFTQEVDGLVTREWLRIVLPNDQQVDGRARQRGERF
jgi:hypothetical protein